IKRVVGLQGELVKTLSYKKEFVRVPEGHCWVEGDHTAGGGLSTELPKKRIPLKLSELK
uniref:Mitochondrial inner membrane protease subunit 2 n=1 Tax=Megaselia scalaris TaxID=36166 RepID=T1H1T8_MEGSC